MERSEHTHSSPTEIIKTTITQLTDVLDATPPFWVLLGQVLIDSAVKETLESICLLPQGGWADEKSEAWKSTRGKV